MLLIALIVSLFAIGECALEITGASKIDSDLVHALESDSFRTANIIVTFVQDTSAVLDSVSAQTFQTREDQISFLVNNLKKLTTSTQENTVNLLQKLKEARSSGLSYDQLWITNQLSVKDADRVVIQALSERSEVSHISKEKVIRMDVPEIVEDHVKVAPTSANLEWNLVITGVEQAWNLLGGNQGEGVVVANIDTGVLATHETLRDNYRKEYGWFDPYFGSTESNAADSFHGTHTMGTIVGTNGIGVAPKAKWINCKGLSNDEGRQTELIRCGQFVLCPHHPNGTGENCAMAPHVVSNSWGGSSGLTFYDGVIEAWKKAAIIPIFAAGNSGANGCRSINGPADRKVIAVGATTMEDKLAPFSSIGPASGGILKPEISAPGALIRSAGNATNSQYITASGTSMATPLVAGVVALMKSRQQNLTYDQVMGVLTHTTSQAVGNVGQTCGGIPSNILPNNHYGHGRINATAAVKAVIDGRLPETTPKPNGANGRPELVYAMAVHAIPFMILKALLMTT